MNYRILCEVSGGVTGYRNAYLKNGGVEVIFPDKETAETEAARLMKKTNGPYRTADFRYTAEPIGGQS
jgi:hypothetical protein